MKGMQLAKIIRRTVAVTRIGFFKKTRVEKNRNSFNMVSN